MFGWKNIIRSAKRKDNFSDGLWVTGKQPVKKGRLNILKE
ncbi:hypothetical protein l11_15270 [Neisseria weaveri LMG 5135]|nr:hypothetical protein l13_16140 [Neisseria weaveri ATCC 51223]EGV36951.1 hypothetical protein l11_15270 [Neisseria weaveri LMG 5135]